MTNEVQRETMEYDVVIVGAGPAGLCTAIKLKQLNKDISAVSYTHLTLPPICSV